MILSPEHRTRLATGAFIFSSLFLGASISLPHITFPDKRSTGDSLMATVVSREEITNSSTTVSLTPNEAQFPYVEVLSSCGTDYSGECVRVRSGPDTSYSTIARLRTGVVLKISDSVTTDGHEWYKIAFDEHIRYPERMPDAWYIRADTVNLLFNEGVAHLTDTPVTTRKHIVVKRGEQMLYAYDGDTLFMKEAISTGLELTPTPRGNFAIFKKTPTRYMQGPLPGIADDYYDLPGVPWNLYFTEQGAAIHGAYWHSEFGIPHSHGCVNMPTDSAKTLYLWADVGTPVTVE